jgi:hypothetical protein
VGFQKRGVTPTNARENRKDDECEKGVQIVRVKVTPAQTETSRVLHADDPSQLEKEVLASEAEAEKG